MTTTPIWFLGLDGVVRAVETGEDRLHLVASADGMPVDVHYSPAVVDAINTIHREGLAEVRWLSNWQQDALDVARAIGLDEFEAYDIPEDETGRWYKAEVVDEVVTKEARPFAWADSNLGLDRFGHLDTALVHPHLLLPTEHEDGLTLDDVARVRAFCERACTGALPERLPHPARAVVFLGDGTVLLDEDSAEGTVVEIESLDGLMEYRVDHHVIGRIAALQEEHDLDVHWLSDLPFEALTAVGHLGLRFNRSHHDTHDIESPMSWWKGSVVLDAVLAKDRPVIWLESGIDDEDLESFSLETNVLLVAPADGRLSTEDLGRLEDFLATLGKGKD